MLLAGPFFKRLRLILESGYTKVACKMAAIFQQELALFDNFQNDTQRNLQCEERQKQLMSTYSVLVSYHQVCNTKFHQARKW